LRSQYLRRRYLTGIVYLNDDDEVVDIDDNNDGRRKPWDVSTDGGQLRIYNNDDNDRGPDDDSGNDADATTTTTTASPTRRIVDDIAPRGGRLVLLSSQSVLHQVLPSRRDRLACSIWFTRDERN
jgi:Rps23 Pro-64 3,4-dihydroxylase Tpa1-like proline 4-hydroxylase